MAQDTAQQAPTAPATPARTLLPLILPALVVGVAASLLLLLVSEVAGRLQDVLWGDLPDALGVGRYSVPWMLVVRPGWGDLLATLVIASVAALLGMCAVYAFPYVHGAFGRLGHPMPALPAGGVVLGLLAALGGHLTLFKGLAEVEELAADPDGWSAGRFATMTVVKLAALVVAACCGFRGGRIFPAVFVGVALGLTAHALVPAVHPAVGVGTGVLGILLAITRHGWVSLFVAAVLVASPAVVALLCIASLPAWLLVTGRPQMQLRADGTPVR